MGTAIVAKNSNAETAGMKKFIPPVTRNLEAWHFLNSDVSKAATNYALGKPNAVVVGSPLEFSEYIQFKGQSNYLQTEVAETATQTIFSVIRTKDTLVDLDHLPAFYGNYRSLTNGGSYLVMPAGGTTLTKVACRFTDVGKITVTSSPVSLASPSAVDFGEWSIIVDITRSGVNAIQNPTKSANAARTDTTYGRKVSPEPYRVGSIYEASSLWRGTADMALWAHYSTELTESEIAAVVARIRAYMSQRQGIIV